MPKMLHYKCLIKKEKQRNEDNLVYANFMPIYVNIIKSI